MSQSPTHKARRRILVLLAVLAAVVFAATIIATYGQYRAAFEQNRMRLLETARSRARLIEAIAGFARRHSHDDLPGRAFAATLSQVREAHRRFRGFGETGEFTLARRKGESIAFLLSHRHGHLEQPAPVPWGSSRAEPMRRALSGKSGAVVGPDYRGVTVLAAHVPVGAHGLGVVAKIDLREIRAPFLRMGALAGLAALVLVAAAGLTFLRVTQPILRQLEGHNDALSAEVRERERIERSLRQSEEDLRTTLRSIGDAVIATDGQGRVTRLNGVAEQLTGWTEAEAAGRPLDQVFRIVNEHTREPVEGPVARVLREGRVVGLANHTILLRRGGDELPIADSGAPIRDEAGRTRGVVLVFRDQTAERDVEQALRESERRYRLLADNTVDVIWTMDTELTFTYVNPAVTSLAGYSPEEWVGTKLSEHCDGENFARMARAAAAEMAKGPNGTGVTVEADMLRKDGSVVPVEIRGKALCDATGAPAFLHGMTRDITERRCAEAERAKLDEQLAQAQKMESIGRLAGGVAHDFNNLLTVVTTDAELLAADLAEDDPHLLEVNEIRQAAARAADLTRQLLAFSRRQIIRPRVIDINDTVAGLGKMLHRLIGEDIELRFRPAPDLLRTRVDPGQIEQIMFNLAVNSRDAMPDGGRLIVETRNVDLDQAYVAGHSEATAGPHVLLAVSDTGCGMDEATRRQVFEPFFTTKGVGKGTGLGLSTVYGIVRQHGGTVAVHSEVGRGTRFEVYLPAWIGESSQPAVTAGPGGEVPRGDQTVLVVEDEDAVRRIAKRILETLGYRVIAAAGASEALAIAADRERKIDLVLADVVMPEMSGKACFDRIAAERPGLRVLYMSGYTENAIARHGVLDEGVAFIHKPFSVESLARKVRAVLDG